MIEGVRKVGVANSNPVSAERQGGSIRNAVIVGVLLLIVIAAIALAVPASHAQTLTGAQAQKSPQAEVFLAYSKALIGQGIDAASVYMTPEKRAEMKDMLKQFGEEGFREFQARMRNEPQGEARRKQIEKVEVKGDHAVLEARDGPGVVSVAFLVRTKDGWKIGVRR